MRHLLRRLGVAACVLLGSVAWTIGVASEGPASAASPGDATVTVVHGIPGVAVDVYVNGQDVLPGFTFGTVSPPLSLPPGSYSVAVKAAGTSTVLLSATETLTADENATIVAHLTAVGDPTLSVYQNPTTPAPAGDAWVLVRHTAEAPGVDVYAGSQKIVSDLTNPNSAGPLAVPAGTIPVSVKVSPSSAGSPSVLGPIDVPLTAGRVTIAYAIGSATASPSTLTAVVQSYPVGQQRSTGGYLLAGPDGATYAFGSSAFAGSLPGLGVSVSDIVGSTTTADGKGYWLVGRDGAVFAFGDAAFYGSLPGLGVKVDDIVGIVPSADDRGYLLVGADGGVYAFGSAPFLGSLPGTGIRVTDIRGAATTPDGGGYWLVDAAGGIYAFGDAPFEGSLPGSGVTIGDVSGIAATGASGYRLVSRDGGVFDFGSATFLGSLPGLGIHVSDVVAITTGATDGGFQLIAGDGSVYAFGDAPYAGSLPGLGIRTAHVVSGSSA